MNSIRLIISFLLISLSTTLSADNVSLTFDNTTICIPTEYVLGPSPFERWLEQNVKGLDSSEGSEILHIPPEIIRKYVPNYIYSHINEHNVDLKHKISGIAYSLSTVGSVYGMANTAWDVYRENKNPLITEEQNSGFFRIFPWGFDSFSWHLVTSPPPKVVVGSPPDEWYIGYCNSTLNTCDQHIIFKDIFFQYHIQILDLKVRKEVANTLVILFNEWYENCGTSAN